MDGMIVEGCQPVQGSGLGKVDMNANNTFVLQVKRLDQLVARLRMLNEKLTYIKREIGNFDENPNETDVENEKGTNNLLGNFTGYNNLAEGLMNKIDVHVDDIRRIIGTE